MAPRLVVADTSVVLKWFHAAGEEAVEPARAILDAFARRQIDLVILDLTIYEIGNILIVGPGQARKRPRRCSRRSPRFVRRWRSARQNA